VAIQNVRAKVYAGVCGVFEEYIESNCQLQTR
jgi:hypothetical protein